MKKLSIYIAPFMAVVLLLSVAVFSFNATVVFEHDGVLYTKLDDDFVSVYGTSGEITSLVIPASVDEGYVSEIGAFALQDNTDITMLDMSRATHLDSLGYMCFNGCSSLSGNLYIPYYVTEVNMGAFQLCSSLESVEFFARTELIPEVCFNRCSSLSKVTICDSVTTIGKLAFANNPLLSEIRIPSSVTDIHFTAFDNDDSLVIYCENGSYAHRFAAENGFEFVLTDVPEPPTEPPTEPEPEGYLLGDTDDNDDVEVVDATWLQRYIALMNIGVIEDTVMQGDVDGDGDPSIVDAAFIMRYCVGIETPFDIGELVV